MYTRAVLIYVSMPWEADYDRLYVDKSGREQADKPGAKSKQKEGCYLMSEKENAGVSVGSKHTLWQAVKFAFFSVSAGIIQLAAFALLDEVFHCSYWVAYGAALVLSILWNFTLNRRYTFRSDMNVPRAMTLVFLFYLVFTPLSTWIGAGLTNDGANEYLVLLGTMLVNFASEYLYQRFVVYRKSIDTNELAQKHAK